MVHKSIIYAELSLALPINKKGTGAQNHKERVLFLFLVCTNEVTVKDGSILVASLDLLKDGINQSTMRKKKPCKTFFSLN